MLKTRFLQGLAPRLILALIVMVALVAGLALASTLFLHNISQRAGKLTESTVPAHVTVTQLSTTAQALLVQAQELSADNPATDRMLLRSRLEGKKTDLRNQVARFLHSNPDVEGLDKLRSDAEKLIEVVDRLVELAAKRAMQAKAQKERLQRLRELEAEIAASSPLGAVIDTAVRALNQRVSASLDTHRKTVQRQLNTLPQPWDSELRTRRAELKHLLLGEGQLFDTEAQLREMNQKLPTASMAATRFADRFTGYLADLRQQTEETLAQDRNYIRILAQRAQGIAWVVPALALALAVALSFFLWRDVVKRLGLLQKAMAGFSAGETYPQVPAGQDEIGNLGSQFVAMAEAINTRQEALERLASEDSLTGTANRRRFYELLEHEVGRIQRSGAPISVAILDVDYFKRINDTLGHDAGDAALCHLVALLQARLRRTDVLGRLGGEEFGLLLLETAPGDAQAVCAELRQLCADNPVPWGAQSIPFSVSIGLTGLDDPTGENALSADRLLTAADKALYASKENGRDQVTLTRLEAAES